MVEVVKFTEAKVKERRARARAGRRDEYQDEELPALWLRVSPTSASWYVLKRIPGSKMKRVLLGNADELAAGEARKLARIRIGEMQQGIDPNVVKQQRKAEAVRRGLTLGEALAIFLAEKDNLRDATRRTYERDLRTTFGDYWDRPIADLTPAVVRIRHRDRKTRALRSQARVGTDAARKRITASPSRADGAVRALRAVVNYLNLTHHLGLPNVAAEITAAKAWAKVPRRERALAGEHLRDFVRAVRALPDDLPPDLTGTQRDVTLLMLCTALRWSNAAGMKWKEIDFKAKSITIAADRMKGKREYGLPLGPEMIAMLRKRFDDRRSNEFVFPGLPKNPKKPQDLHPINRLTVHFMAKLTDGDGAPIAWSPHDLRRTALSALEAMDVSAYALKRIAGHAVPDDDPTAGYLVFQMDRLRVPIERLEAAVFGRKLNIVDMKSQGERRR